MKAPWWWWCCCGWHWRSLSCVADTLLHKLHVVYQPICDAHDRLIQGDA